MLLRPPGKLGRLAALVAYAGSQMKDAFTENIRADGSCDLTEQEVEERSLLCECFVTSHPCVG